MQSKQHWGLLGCTGHNRPRLNEAWQECPPMPKPLQNKCSSSSSLKLSSKLPGNTLPLRGPCFAEPRGGAHSLPGTLTRTVGTPCKFQPGDGDSFGIGHPSHSLGPQPARPEETKVLATQHPSPLREMSSLGTVCPHRRMKTVQKRCNSNGD